MRIFLGLTEVSGFFQRLKHGFDQLNIEAVHVSLQPHRFSYSGKSKKPQWVDWAQYSVIQRLKSSRAAAPVRVFWVSAVIVTRLLLFTWALVRFDVFILGAGSSFFSFRELPLMRLLGKKIIYTLHGTDARPPYIDGFFSPEHYGLSEDKMEGQQTETVNGRAKRLASAHATVALRRCRQVQAIERNVSSVICAPNYCHFLTRPFISFYSVGLPTLPIPYAGGTPKLGNNAPVRLLHAPSDLRGKGTYEIREVIANLRERGLAVEYVEITNRPNTEVLKEIDSCDMVIDQLYAETPMSGYGAEAAMAGKPALVGGYYSAHIKGHVPASQIPPSAFCLPEELSETIAALVEDQNRRIQLGEDARRYVAERWEAKVVAGRFLRIIEGDIPNDWMIDPRQVAYLHGNGQNERQARANIAALIEFGGVAALQLSHRPDLENLFVQFAAAAEPPCSNG